MKLSVFLKEIKNAVHEQGYRLNELDLVDIEVKQFDCFQINLIDRNDEEFSLTIENPKNL